MVQPNDVESLCHNLDFMQSDDGVQTKWYNPMMRNHPGIVQCNVVSFAVRVFMCMQSDDGVQTKWYNPMTWNVLRPKGTEDFKGEGLRGGINSVSYLISLPFMRCCWCCAFQLERALTPSKGRACVEASTR